MRIAVATDHRGLALKAEVARFLAEAGHEVRDLGSHEEGAVDYQRYAFALAEAVAAGEVERGVLICGTGIGMSIAANKVPGVRAALVYDDDSVRLSREHNDANVLVLPGNWLPAERARQWLRLWLDTPFAGGRHVPRLALISDYDSGRRGGD